MFKRLALIILSAALTLTVAAASPAQAKRLGGGQSSGSKSGFSSSPSPGYSGSQPLRSSPPPTAAQPSAQPGSAQNYGTQPQSPLPGPGLGTAAAPSRPWGGFLGGMLAGGILGLCSLIRLQSAVLLLAVVPIALFAIQNRKLLIAFPRCINHAFSYRVKYRHPGYFVIRRTCLAVHHHAPAACILCDICKVLPIAAKNQAVFENSVPCRTLFPI